MYRNKIIGLSILSTVISISAHILLNAGNTSLLPLIPFLTVPFIYLEIREKTGRGTALSFLIQAVFMLILKDIVMFAFLSALGAFSVMVVKNKKSGFDDTQIIFSSAIIFVVLSIVMLQYMGMPELSKSQEMKNELVAKSVEAIDDEILRTAGLSEENVFDVLLNGLNVFIGLLPATVITGSAFLSLILYYLSMSVLRKKDPENPVYGSGFMSFFLPRRFGGIAGLSVLFFIILSQAVPSAKFFMNNLVYLGYSAYTMLGLSTVYFIERAKIPMMILMIFLMIFMPYLSFAMFLLGVAEQIFGIRQKILLNGKR